MKNKLTYIIDDDKLTKLMSILISKSKQEIHSFYNAQLAIDTLKKIAIILPFFQMLFYLT
jgi:hypothetical protein